MTKATKLALATLFFVSGAVSLVFEVLWIRILSLGVGSTSASMSLVLSIFFFGLGLGSFLAGRYLARTKRPLLVYGLLEGFAGLYGCGVVFLLIDFQAILSGITSLAPWLTQPAPLFALKFLLVGVLLIAPTLCMGASLPLMTKAVAEHESTLGQSVGLFYGLNTLGAVFGALLTSFLLIPSIGVLAANYVAAAGGVLVFLVAYAVQRSLSRRPADAVANNTAASSAPTFPLSTDKALTPLILIACTVSGISSISAQVVWNKYLSIFFGTNIFGIGLTLSVFLLGLAVGSLVCARFVDKLSDRLTSLYALLLASVVAMVFSSYALDLAPLVAGVLAAALPGTANLLAVKCLVAGLIIFVPTSIFGAILPLCIKTITQRLTDAPRRIGMAYAFNTAGSIFGSCIAGLVIIPQFGSTVTIRIAAALLALTALAIALVQAKRAATTFKPWRLAGAVAVALLAVSLNQISFENIIKTAYFQNLSAGTKVSDVLKDLQSRQEDFQVIFEGANGVISLSHDPADGAAYKDYLRLKTSGLNESVYNMKDLESLPKYEALLGFIPFAYQRAPKTAFVVGFGGGYTVDFMTSTPLKKVVVAELEPAILDATRYARGQDTPIFTRANLQMEIEDARLLLSSPQSERYDIIVSQPSHSWLPGAANLFTREFFTIVRDRLTDDGAYSQWLNLYNMDTETLKSILGTFYAVFEHGLVFTDKDDHELIMLGSKQALVTSPSRIEAILRDHKFRKQLEHVPITNAADFLSLAVLDRATVLSMTKGAPINTDLNAYAETRQSRIFYAKEASVDDVQGFMHSHFNAEVALQQTGPTSPLSRDAEAAVLESMLRLKKYDKFHPLYTDYEAKIVAGDEPRLQAGLFAIQAERYATAAAHLSEELRQRPATPTLEALGSAMVQSGRAAEYLKLVAAHKALSSEIIDCYAAEATLQSDPAAGATSALVTKLLAQAKTYEAKCGSYFDKVAGEALLARGHSDAAITYLERYYAAYGQDPTVVAAMLRVYLARQDWTNARAFASYLPTLLDRRLEQLSSLAAFYDRRGFAADAQALREKAKRLSAVPQEVVQAAAH